MDKKPEVSPGQWIKIGKRDAVVCNVHADHIEVVYLDDRNRAINEDVGWDGSQWTFKRPGPSGGYADKYPRLYEYLSILRRGTYANRTQRDSWAEQ
jgi:hypothetical protein